MSLIKRIKQVIDFEGISISAFEQQIGASDGMIRRAIKNNTDIQSKWLPIICDNYHDMNIEWLITGKGDMFGSSNRVEVSGKEQVSVQSSTRPRIPLHAAAGSLTIAESGVMFEECEQLPIIETLPKYDFTIRVRGNSMVPEFHSGDEVACLFIREQPFIQWGRIHVLDTAQGIIMKMLDDGGDCYICRSANASYKEFKIPKPEVYNIALVVGLVRTY